MQDSSLLILGIIAGVVIGFLIAKLFFYVSIRGHRAEAVRQSKNVTLGYVNEKIAPLLPDFPYSYKDLVFLGKGVDYLVFDGLSEGTVREVVLLEIKTGGSQLNKNEKLIKQAITAGRVSYKVLRLS